MLVVWFFWGRFWVCMLKVWNIVCKVWGIWVIYLWWVGWWCLNRRRRRERCRFVSRASSFGRAARFWWWCCVSFCLICVWVCVIVCEFFYMFFLLFFDLIVCWFLIWWCRGRISRTFLLRVGNIDIFNLFVGCWDMVSWFWWIFWLGVVIVLLFVLNFLWVFVNLVSDWWLWRKSWKSSVGFFYSLIVRCFVMFWVWCMFEFCFWGDVNFYDWCLLWWWFCLGVWWGCLYMFCIVRD